MLSGKELPKPRLLCTTDEIALGQSDAGVEDVKPVLDVDFKEGQNKILVEALSKARSSYNAELPTINGYLRGFFVSSTDAAPIIVVMGDGYIGKTKFIRTYVTQRCSEYESAVTVLEHYLLKVPVGDIPHSLLLFDTAGLKGYEGLRPFMYQETDVFIACGLIGNTSSFKNLESSWLYEIRRAGRDIPAIFVGLKDPDNYPPLSTVSGIDEREVEQYRGFGERLECEFSGVRYMECTIGSFSTVEAVFDEVCNIPRTKG
ncbi:ras family-domain-containing protein [Podospora aff. communis PSN243]|uniref:Ras family-domain-containing protein n=1 Tax=Podospora aff. communis PSN243 TaxID=3040156 RepID=A0AAV9GX70_9PEZI|nr:ras family-domain-containing protein [Podospora aff. communis PSN243]